MNQKVFEALAEIILVAIVAWVVAWNFNWSWWGVEGIYWLARFYQSFGGNDRV
jgi:hypothetical protein